MKLKDYECRKCERLFEVLDEEKYLKETIACECGAKADRLMSAPGIHTLETHMRGTRGFETECDGSYLDHELCASGSGKPTLVKSLKHKKQLLKDHGLYEKDNDERIQTKRRKASSIQTSVPAALTA